MLLRFNGNLTDVENIEEEEEEHNDGQVKIVDAIELPQQSLAEETSLDKTPYPYPISEA